MIGTMQHKPTVRVNSNVHLAVHPPLLRQVKDHGSGSKTQSEASDPNEPEAKKPEKEYEPYPVLTKPQPHYAFRNNPNYTPHDPAEDIKRREDHVPPRIADRREMFKEVEDKGRGAELSPAAHKWGPQGVKLAEIDPDRSETRRWVGTAM